MLRSPYSTTAGMAAATQPAERTASVLTAVAATAKPGLDGAAKPGAAEADSTASNGAAPSGDAKDPQEIMSERQRAGILPAGGDTAPAESLAAQQKQSPFAAVEGRLSRDSSPAVRCERSALLQTLTFVLLQHSVSALQHSCAELRIINMHVAFVHSEGLEFLQSDSTCRRRKQWRTDGGLLRALRASSSMSQTTFQTTWTPPQRTNCAMTVR